MVSCEKHVVRQKKHDCISNAGTPTATNRAPSQRSRSALKIIECRSTVGSEDPLDRLVRGGERREGGSSVLQFGRRLEPNT